MSAEAMQAILERISADPEFRTKVIYRPGRSLAEYDLTDAERKAFEERSFEGLGLPGELAAALRNQLDTSGF